MQEHIKRFRISNKELSVLVKLFKEENYQAVISIWNFHKLTDTILCNTCPSSFETIKKGVPFLIEQSKKERDFLNLGELIERIQSRDTPVTDAEVSILYAQWVSNQIDLFDIDLIPLTTRKTTIFLKIFKYLIEEKQKSVSFSRCYLNRLLNLDRLFFYRNIKKHL